MPDQPFASVIIPSFNGKPLLATCLDGLLLQTYPAELFEVIVVDDASSDGTVAFVRECYPHVRVVALAENQGFVAACNTGVDAARGDPIVMLNNDTEPEPGWLEALLSALMANPQAGSAASKLLLFDRREILHTAGDLMGVDGLPRNRGVWQEDRGQFDGDRWVFGACGGAAAYRREAWQALGGFDRRLFMYMEDVDLAWRLQLAGWPCIFVPQARVYHRLSATGGGALSSYYTGRNTIWVILRNWPAALLRRHWSSILGAQVRIACDALRAWRGQAARARLRGQLAGVLGIPKVLRQRGAIQAQRQVSIEYLEDLLTH